jgi:hypothetical protein
MQSFIIYVWEPHKWEITHILPILEKCLKDRADPACRVWKLGTHPQSLSSGLEVNIQEQHVGKKKVQSSELVSSNSYQ